MTEPPTPPTRWPSLLSVKQAAEMVGVDHQTMRVWVREGVLRARKQSTGSFVLSRSELLIDIARHRQDVAANRARGAQWRAARGLPPTGAGDAGEVDAGGDDAA